MRRGALVTLALLGAACLASSACSKKKQPEPANDAKLAGYTVRGRILTMPEPGKPASELQIHHEPIPEFKSDWTKLPDGMNEMAMPFPVAEGVSLAPFKPGEAVEFTFVVEYDPATGKPRGYRIVRLTPLPPGAALQIRE